MQSNEPVKILLVDDTPSNLVALSAILDHSDYQLVFANSGKDALEHAITTEFAVVLLDVMMPDMDGFAVASSLKKEGANQHTPIIFLTALAHDSVELYKGYEVGGVDYIHKPLDAAVVRAKVAVFVALCLQRREIERQAEIIRRSERAEYLQSEHAARLAAERAEQRFLKLVNALDHAIIWEADVNMTRFSFVSERVDQLLGYPRLQWLEEPHCFLRHMPADDRPGFLLTLSRAQHAKPGSLGERCEHRLVAQNGMEMWFHTGLQIEHDEAGTPVLLRGLSVDISPMKRVEHALRDSEERLEFSLQAASLALWDWNLLSGSLVWSDTLKRLFGYDAAEFRQSMTDFWSRVHPEDRALVNRAFTETMHTDIANTIEFRVLWPDDSERWIQLTGRAFREFADKVVRISGIALDVTERRKTEQLRESLVSELRDAVQARDDIAAIIAHDLKNPLAAIHLNADIMVTRAEQGRPLTKHIQHVKRAAERALRLAEDFLDVSKVETGRFTVDLRHESALALVTQAIDLMRPIAQQKSIDLSSRIGCEDIEVACDYERILQVFSNLIGNAVKFTPASGRVTVSARQVGESVEFSVADTGVGISSEEIPHLFKRYWQAAEGKRRGLGLGLYIAEGIIRSHHGDIWVTSESGVGTTFFFTLPIVA